MTPWMRLVVGLGWCVLMLVGGGCQADEDETMAPSAPLLLTPLPQSSMAQNTPELACPAHPTRGFGFRLVFTWREAEASAGIARYHLRVQHRQAPVPILETVVTDTTWTAFYCNTFVADDALADWEWQVQAEDTRGHRGPWSITGVFHMQPCRLSDGTPCHAPL